MQCSLNYDDGVIAIEYSLPTITLDGPSIMVLTVTDSQLGSYRSPCHTYQIASEFTKFGQVQNYLPI